MRKLVLRKLVLRKLVLRMLALMLVSLCLLLTGCGKDGWIKVGNYKMEDVNVRVQRKQLFSGWNGEIYKDSPNIVSDGKNIRLSWGLHATNTIDLSTAGQIAVSNNLGETFNDPIDSYVYKYEEGGIGYKFSPIVPVYSKKHNVYFTIGMLNQYNLSSNVMTNHGAKVMWTMNDPETGLYAGAPQKLEFPYENNWCYTHGQPIEFDNGDFMFTFYYEPVDGVNSGMGSATTYDTYFRTVTARYSFDGKNFTLVKAGTPIEIQAGRGAGEPCLAKYGDKYYLTIRTDANAYLAWSNDGYTFSEPIRWTFNDGSILGSRNTQQRWVRHQNGLFLVYTRDNGKNSYVMRNRAPLYMAKFDEEHNCLIKETEIELIPNRGASLANMIGSCEVGDNETYIAVAESMQPATGKSIEEIISHGADNSIWLIKITT